MKTNIIKKIVVILKYWCEEKREDVRWQRRRLIRTFCLKMKGRKVVEITKSKTRSRIFLFLNVFILCHPILDVLTSLATRIGLPITPGVVIRTLFMGIGFLYVLFVSEFKHKKICVTYLIAVTVYCGLFIINMYRMGGLGYAVGNFPELIKAFYFPYIAATFYAVYCHLGYRVSDKILALVVFQYVFIIFIGFITGTGYAAYSNGRGAIGWFYAGNEVSGIVSILTPVAMLYAFKILSEKTDKKPSVALKVFSVLMILFCCFGACYVGTKVAFITVTVYVACCIIWGIVAWFTNKTKANAIVLVVSFVTCIIMIGSYFVSPLRANIDTVMKPTLQDIQDEGDEVPDEEEIPLDGLIYPEFQSSKFYKVLNAVMSNRIYFSLPTVKEYDESGIITKLLGIGYQNHPSYENSIEKAIEIDVLAFYCRHGIVGAALMYVPIISCLVYIIIKFFKKFKENFASLSCCTYFYALIMAVAISTFTGHTLVAPAVSIYVAILFVNMFIREKNEAIKKEEMTSA